jgi:alkylation response protein AidB-like acyl-CoA dehydrogenase
MTEFDPAYWRAQAAASSVDGPNVEAGLAIAVAAAAAVRPGSAVGAIAVLDALAAGDLTVARVVEPHLDALAILREAGVDAPAGTWGVFAAEAPGARLTATAAGGGWSLTGDKPWCSLAGRLDRALVTAHVPDGRRLFAVDLHDPGVVVADVAWTAKGLTEVTSSPVRFDRVPVIPVGETDWYLHRPGFAWGAVRVAACWLGGTRAVLDSLRADLAARSDPGEIRLYNLGSADAAVWAADLAVRHAANAIDDGVADGAAGNLLAARVRAVVAAGAETVLMQSAHARGPAPLAFDEVHGRRVADLELYIRQHHAERDLAALGRMTLPG